MFLRDSCTCRLCVDPSSRQKNFSTVDIPEGIQARTIDYGTDSLRLTWKNDIPGFPFHHTTTLSYDVLAARNNKADRNKDPIEQYTFGQHYWDGKHLRENVSVIDYEAYANDPVVLLATLHALRKYGVVFLRNVPDSEHSVVNIAERIGPLKNTFYGNTWDVRSVPEAKNVAYTHGHLGFHMDLLYMRDPPRLQFLHCLRSSSSGGASLFADAFRAARGLTVGNNSFHSVKHIETAFHYHNDNKHYLQHHPLIETGPKNRLLTAVNWSPPFQAAVSSNRKKLRAWYDACKAFNDNVERKESVYERQMQPGDCVIFDNRRVLHARTAFTPGDAGKERWLKGAYLDMDPWLSTMRVLEETLGLASKQDVVASTENAPEASIV